MVLHQADWPYEWPRRVECSQGARAVRFEIRVTDLPPGSWIAGDGTIVYPFREGRRGHVAFSRQIVVSNVMAAAAVPPDAGFTCRTWQETANHTLLSFDTERAPRDGVYVCRLTRADGSTVDQRIALVQYSP